MLIIAWGQYDIQRLSIGRLDIIAENFFRVIVVPIKTEKASVGIVSHLLQIYSLVGINRVEVIIICICTLVEVKQTLIPLIVLEAGNFENPAHIGRIVFHFVPAFGRFKGKSDPEVTII